MDNLYHFEENNVTIGEEITGSKLSLAQNVVLITYISIIQSRVNRPID